MRGYLKDFWDNCKNSAKSILPFFAIILILYLVFLPFNIWTFLSLVIATLFMCFGMAFFSAGIDMSVMKMGGYVGSHLSKSRKLSLMLILSLIMGFAVTIAEPDLLVLAEQVPGANTKWIILLTVSLGTGIFLLLSTLRTIFRWDIKKLLIGSYVVLGVLAVFGNAYVPLAFDCEGITTGAISVPFIMAFGLGICAVRSGVNNQEDGFGLIALASVGSAMSIMIVSLFLKSEAVVNEEVIRNATTALQMGNNIASSLLSYLKEVLLVLTPIVLFFTIYNLVYLKLPKMSIGRIFIGLIYAFVGLVVFLTGVSIGYLPLANDLGMSMASGDYTWTTVPLGIIIGFVLVFAEPAMHIVAKQIEDITEGIIRRKTILFGTSIGVAVAVGLSIVRCLFQINYLYFIIPLIVVIIILSIFTPTLFVSIAFDSGGTAAGTLSCSFILPFIIGICTKLFDSAVLGKSIMLYAFGAIGIIALMPVVVIEIMGIRYNAVLNKDKKKRRRKVKTDIIIYEFD